jgi:hypothetical protein
LDQGSLSALRRVADVPVLVAFGFALYGVGIWLAVAEARWMPVGLARILAVQRHLDAGAGPVGGVAALGSSVVLEGLDCGPLRARLAPGTPCENLAWTGGDLRQWLLIEPALRRSPPRVVLLGLDLFTLLDPGPIPVERLAIAGWWRFVPPAEMPVLAAALSAEERAVLLAPRLSQLLRFRSFPASALNEHVREIARSDLRYEGYTDNFDAPWVRRTPSSPEALDKHLAQTTERVLGGGVERLPETVAVLETLVQRVRAAAPETRFALVLTPVHPRLAAALAGETLDVLRRELAAQAERLDARVLDHSTALGDDGFSDAVHPFGAGRDAWSARLGDELRPLLPE